LIGDEIFKLLKELVSVPTPTGFEGAIFDILADTLKERGFSIKKQMISTGINLIALRGEEGPLFVTHMDTFPAYGHPKPYCLRREGDLLIGRGVVDAKGQIAALIAAVGMTKGPCRVALVVDEERKGTGSKELGFDKDTQAVVLEPTGLKPAISQAGAIEFEVMVYGEAAHGCAAEADNAIMKAIEMIGELSKLKFLEFSHPLFPLAEHLVTIGKIEGGHEPMVVPSLCKFQADIRVLPGVKMDQALREILAWAASYQAELNLIDLAPPCELPQAYVTKKLFEAIKDVTKEEPRPVGMPSWTDAANLDVPAVIFGAGDLKVAHSDWEYVPLADLKKLSLILARLIEIW
jgi:acetylornithine deacetylase/succinyl-diaminopimelate desuccinylase-like protein